MGGLVRAFGREPATFQRTLPDLIIDELAGGARPEMPRAGMPFDRELGPAQQAYREALSAPRPEYEPPEEPGLLKKIVGTALGGLAGMSPGGPAVVSYNLFERPRELAQKRYERRLESHNEHLADLLRKAELEQQEREFQLEATSRGAQFERDVAAAEKARRGPTGKDLLEERYSEAFTRGDQEEMERIAEALEGLDPGRPTRHQLINIKRPGSSEVEPGLFDPVAGLVLDPQTREPIHGATRARHEPDELLAALRSVNVERGRSQLPLETEEDVENATRMVLLDPSNFTKAAPTPAGRRKVLAHMRKTRRVPMGRKQQERMNLADEMEARVERTYQMARRISEALQKRFGSTIFAKGAAFIKPKLEQLGLSEDSPELLALDSFNQATIPLYARFIGQDVGNLSKDEQARGAKAQFHPWLSPKQLDALYREHIKLLNGRRRNINNYATQVWLGDAVAEEVNDKEGEEDKERELDDWAQKIVSEYGKRAD